MHESSSGSTEKPLWTGTQVAKRELRESGIRPLRRRGQNFLVSARTAAAIVDACELNPGDIVVEIGAGLGALTVPLAWTGSTIHAVELDRGLAAILARKVAGKQNVQVLNKDFLRFDLGEYAVPGERLVIVGNLPYYASTEIILRLVRNRAYISRAIITVQREYAERLRAKPGSKHYGSLTVLVSLHADVRKLLNIPPQAFYPKPNVGSQALVVSFLKRPRIALHDEAAFETMVRGLFSERRKTILNRLSKVSGVSKNTVEGILNECGIPVDTRPEQLSLESFAELYGHIADE